VYDQASIDFWDIGNPLQEDSRQCFVEAMKFIANRYRNNKYLLFGTVNEPFCGNSLVNLENAEYLSVTYARLVERIIDAIRSTGAKQVVFVDKPYVWDYTNHFEAVNRDNIVWEDHAYVWPAAPRLNLEQWKTAIEYYGQTYVYALGKPFYVGEYGPYPYDAYSNELQDWRNILSEQVAFLKTSPVCGYSWHEYPVLEGEWYDYYYNYLTQEDSDYILQTIYQ
jgi:hypothetical protein